MTDRHANPSGLLVLVSTPIGNLGDLSERAVAALRDADAVLCEDTRHTRKLTSHFGISTQLVSYHDHNKERITESLVERLRGGETLALVSDAGTPSLADPGFYITRAAIAAGVAVTSVPGANALLPALQLSGLPTDRFVFEGFAPKKSGQMENTLKAVADDPRTLVYYVSRYSIVKFLAAVETVLADRPAAVCREMTKQFEEVVRGTAAELRVHFEQKEPKGEFVVVIGGAPKRRRRDERSEERG